MDRVLYIAGTGARELMHRQDVQANNLANASTPGFRSEIAAQRTAPVVGGPGLRTRAYAVETTPGADMTRGPMMATGRTLDAAVQGDGWFAVRSADGSEAYTRAGNFELNPDGTLVDASGRPVLADGGEPVVIPPTSAININSDGSISAIPSDDRTAAALAGNLKLVNPPVADMVRGGDGLFRLKNGQAAPAADDVRISSGMLEGSNVNAVDAMVTMISAARHFDVQTQLIQKADENDRAATELLTLT